MSWERTYWPKRRMTTVERVRPLVEVDTKKLGKAMYWTRDLGDVKAKNT